MRGQAGGGSGSHLDAHTERCITAYSIINRFLQSFVDHVSHWVCFYSNVCYRKFQKRYLV